MSLREPAIPPAVVDKCFIQYSPDSPPSLYGVPVGPTDHHSNSSICLAPGLLFKAVAMISEAFASGSSSPLLDSNDSNKNTLPVTVICSPHLNSLVAVDAAVRHIAHRVEADVVILDPADLAAGRQSVFGEELTDAFWHLYSYHYQEPDRRRKRSDSSSSDGSHSDKEHGLGMSDDDSDRRSASGNPQLAKIEDSPFTRAKALVRNFFLMQSSANTDAENLLNRRRILYLRDYGSLCKAMLPLLPALYDAVSSGSPTLVVAGISPIQRVVLPGDSCGSNRKSMRFLDELEGDDFMEYLHSRYCAIWRKPSPDSVEQYQSLEDIFTSMFINRYQGKGIASRSTSNSVSLRDRQHMELRFTRIVRVGLLHDPPCAVQDVSQSERRKRFLLANLWLIHHNAALQGKCLDFNIDYCRDSYIDQGSNSEILTALESSILGNKQLKQVASTLPSSAELSDVLRALTEAEKDISDTEWREMLQIAKSQVSGQPTVDPIVACVRADSSLNSYEEQLFSGVIDPMTIRTTFAEVCVKPEIIDTLRTAVSYPILFPEAYTTGILAHESIGGVLLFGPPGTGKTMACRALAKECGARMLQLQASTIQHCHVGESEKLISAAFALARRLGPCVIFIDELDALFCKRDGSSKEWHRTLVTEFTQEMDGLNTADANRRTGLVVVGATNRPQDIDSAVVRRLSRRILVDLPTLQQRRAIIAQFLKGEVYDKTVDIAKIAARTPLFSGSDLRYLVHSAALAAFKDTVPTLWQQYGTDGVPIPELSRTPLAPRVIQGKHFDQALKEVSASSATNRKDLDELRRWAKELFQSDYCS